MIFGRYTLPQIGLAESQLLLFWLIVYVNVARRAQTIWMPFHLKFRGICLA